MIAVCSGFSYACYSLCCVLPVGLLPLIGHVTKEQMSSINTLLLVLDFCLLPFFGWVAMRQGRSRVMFISALLSAILAPLFFYIMSSPYLWLILSARISLVILGVAFAAPFYAWAQELVEKRHRYSIISIGYALGSQLLGAPFAALTIWIYKKTGSMSWVSIYWMAIAALTIVVLKWRRAEPQKNVVLEY